MLDRRILGWGLGAALLLAAAPGTAQERPAQGAALELRSADPDTARLHLALRAPGLRPALLDPRDGAALRIGTSAAPGRCRIERVLEPARWQRLSFLIFVLGWLYWDVGPEGAVIAFLGKGSLQLWAFGPVAACDLAGEPASMAQPVPLRAEVSFDGHRFCGAFGGEIARNEPGAFLARDAPRPAACADGDVTAANLNVLHGINCPAATAQCRLLDRMDLLADWIVDAGCPDVVTLQEVGEGQPFVPISVRETIVNAVAGRCPFEYETVFEPVSGLDEELLLSRYPVLDTDVLVLHAGFPAPIRHVTHVRVDHPIGPLDVFSTHFSSGADFATQPCGNAFAACPARCLAAGVATNRECQALQASDYVAERHDVDAPALFAGDLNARPDSAELATLRDAGWIDTHLASGNAECDPATGVGCTSGRQDDDLPELESPVSNQAQRIDYILLVPPGPGSTCAAALDGPGDDDGDGTATGGFAHQPNPFAPACGAAPAPLCWPSDHDGNALDLGCR